MAVIGSQISTEVMYIKIVIHCWVYACGPFGQPSVSGKSVRHFRGL